MRLLKGISFSLAGIIVAVLMAGSVVEQICGTAVAREYVYAAPWTIALWVAAAVSGMAYMCVVRLYRQVVTFLLHFSFVIILGGALVTHLFGEQGKIHLRTASPEQTEMTDISLPFRLTLTDFSVRYYQSTNAPMDYVSGIEVIDGDVRRQGQVSMNHVFKYRHYRFYQSMYDTDMQGVTLRVCHDPWGIGITYTGYAMLLLSMLLFFLQQRTEYRAIIKRVAGGEKRAVSAVMLLLLPLTLLSAKEPQPPTLSRQTAEEYCNLYVYYNDRVCPLGTLAKDFTVKLYGKPSYKGLSAEQVLCGWLFYYDRWAKEPCIRIKGEATRRTLGIESGYACLNDFTGRGVYKLEDALRHGDKDAKAADEKFQLVSMVCTGAMLKIYPFTCMVSQLSDSTVTRFHNYPVPQLHWYSCLDRLPQDITYEQWQFVVGAMEYVALCVARNADTEARDALRKIRLWQQAQAGADNLPSERRFMAEMLYNSLNITRPLAMACTAIGLVLFLFCCLLTANGGRLNRRVQIVFVVLMASVALLLTLIIALRWIVSAHVPLSNGHETMTFLAWVSAVLSVFVTLRSNYSLFALHSFFSLPFGFIICGMTLMVSMMSESNPQVTNLMPVLQSPLLTLHVAVIMVAYSLLAFVMLNGVAALVLKDSREPLMQMSRLLLYPAVFCLATGIFLGAVWANISWGRYWGWDPKEVWALITMLVYSALLHTGSLRWLHKPLVFHIYSVVAFLFVLFTYFGVNFLLGGLHSYA